MNTTNLVGGGMVILALGWLSCLLILFFLGLPRVPTFFKAVLYMGSAISGGAVGLAILGGGTTVFGLTTDVTALAFVAAQIIGTWGFSLSMLIWIARNNALVGRSEQERQGEVMDEIQSRGKRERPGVVKDQEEGSDHRHILQGNAEEADARRVEDDKRRAEDDERRAEDDERRAEDDERRDA